MKRKVLGVMLLIVCLGIGGTTVASAKISNGEKRVQSIRIENGWELKERNYFYNKDGINQKGWIHDGYDWYLLGEFGGGMSTGWYDTGHYRYYMNPGSGVMSVGWSSDEYGYTYHKEDGRAYSEEWLTYNDNRYYFPKGQYMSSAKYEYIDDAWHYFNEYGVWIEAILS